jgi:hypothetical protein
VSGLGDRQAARATQTDFAAVGGLHRQTAGAPEADLAGIGGRDRQTASATQTDLAGVGGLDGSGIGLSAEQPLMLLSS